MHQNNVFDVILVLSLLTYFTPCSSVSIVEFKQVNVSWVLVSKINKTKTHDHFWHKVINVALVLQTNWTEDVNWRWMRHLEDAQDVFFVNIFQPNVTFKIETNYLFCSAKQMTGFYMEHNTGLQWIKVLVKHLNSFMANISII